MAKVIGAFAKHLLRDKIFIDSCSPLRHRLAKLKLCQHKGTHLTMKEYYEKEVQEHYEACHPYPRLFNVQGHEHGRFKG